MEILPEWLAYHYHALSLRHLVVAVDPSSTTNPRSLFDKFQTLLPDLQIEQWSDQDFMPNFFLNGSYELAPNFMGVELHDKETYEHWYTTNKVGPVKRRDMTHVNNHRYRQTRFLSQCSRHLVQRYPPPQQPLLATLDSDEYLVVNPWIVNSDPFANTSQRPPEHVRASKSSGSPSKKPNWRLLEAGSILQWLVDSHNITNTECLPIPRLLFGSVETNASDDTTLAMVRGDNAAVATSKNSKSTRLLSIPRSSTQLDTLRWKFHADFNDTRNFQQKVILNLHQIPNGNDDNKKSSTPFTSQKMDEIWGDHVNSVHRPSRRYCPKETSTDLFFHSSAVAAFHYIGSMERYFSRPHDLRRNRKRYRERSNLTSGRESGWIDQWLPQFIDYVGMDIASELLGSSHAATQERKT